MMSNNIKNLRTSKGWSLAELAKRVGVSSQHVHRLEKAENRLNEDTIISFMKAFNCSMDELLGDETPNLQTPVRIIVGGGEKIDCKQFTDDAIMWVTPQEVGFPFLPNHAYAQVSGDSMSPRAESGDFLVYNENDVKSGDNIESLIGMKIIAITSENEGYYKLLRKGSKTGRYNLHSLNSSHIIENVRVQCAVPITAVIDRQSTRRK